MPPSVHFVFLRSLVCVPKHHTTMQEYLSLTPLCKRILLLACTLRIVLVADLREGRGAVSSTMQTWLCQSS